MFDPAGTRGERQELGFLTTRESKLSVGDEMGRGWRFWCPVQLSLWASECGREPPRRRDLWVCNIEVQGLCALVASAISVAHPHHILPRSHHSETLGWECGLGIVRAASMVWRSNRRDWPPFGGDFKLASFKLDPKISGAKRLKTRIEARRLTGSDQSHHTALPEPSG